MNDILFDTNNYPSFYDLGPDVLAIIVSYLHDPRDLISLYNSDRWLFRHIMDWSVREIFTDPDTTIYLPPYVLERFTNLRSLRTDLRIEYMSDLLDIIYGYPKIKELCLRISSQTGPPLLQIAAYIMCGNIENTYYRLEQYNPNATCFDQVWMGGNKISHGPGSHLYSFLILYRNYIESILTEGSSFCETEYVDILSEIPGLKSIYYTDCGYLPCSAEQLHLMLTINQSMKRIICVPCSYYYEIDHQIKFDEVDKFLSNLSEGDNIYDSISTLVLPIDPRDCIYLKSVFPNLDCIGIRFIHQVTSIGFQKPDFSDINVLKEIYNNITIFVYIIFPTIEIRQEISRNPEIIPEIAISVCDMITDHCPSHHVVNMTGDLLSLMLTRDNWLFNTTY